MKVNPGNKNGADMKGHTGLQSEQIKVKSPMTLGVDSAHSRPL